MAVDKKALKAAQDEIDFEKFRYQVHLETTAGTIRLDLWPDVAPGHCLNILGLAKTGFYDGLIFHRVIKGFVIQGGCPNGDGTGGPGYKIKAEFNDRPHLPGVLSMARTQDPNSAGSQFFLCLGQIPYLDGQYTAFGKAADDESLAVIMRIGDVETDGGDRPLTDVTITRATVVAQPV